MKKRKIAIYFSWSRPKEADATIGDLENRYPTLYEFRRAHWPKLEGLKNPEKHQQDVTGFLEHIILPDFNRFTRLVKEKAGTEVTIIEREGGQQMTGKLDSSFPKGFDTLIIVSLDHLRTDQAATQGEIDFVRDFLKLEARCVFICPHHDIGAKREPSGEEIKLPDEVTEWSHHLDPTIPGKQSIGGFARSLLYGLGFNVRNRWGLNPKAEADGSPSPLLLNRDLDPGGLLNGVTTFNVHPHLPHLEFTPGEGQEIDLLARQLINPHAKPHPFVEAGNSSFHALLGLRAPQQWSGRIFVCDATLWSKAFGGLKSLEALWTNVATMD